MRSLRKSKPTKELFKSEVKLPPKRKGKSDLLGPKGQGTFLLEQGFVLARQYDLDPYEIEKEMKSKDYKNLLKVFDKYFGDKVAYVLE